MKIAAHTLIKNEARFIWFSVTSVIDYIDKLYLWDTGSTDDTPRILEALKETFSSKIDLRFLDSVDINEFSIVRQKMLDQTKEDWFLVVDGDEIWWDESIRKVLNEIYNNGGKLESIVVPTINLIGDMYHYQEEKAGYYKLAGKIGHLNLRAVNRKIPGLASDKPHGTWGWIDKDKKMIQDRDQNKINYIDAPYLHATFLRRAGVLKHDRYVPKRALKNKYEIGIKFPLDFYYPESFFRPKPDFVQSPWETMDTNFFLRALLETPLKKIKRRVIPPKIGY